MSQVNYANSMEMKGMSQTNLVSMEYGSAKRKVYFKNAAILYVITVAILVGLCIGLYFIGRSDGFNEGNQASSTTVTSSPGGTTVTPPSNILATPNLGYRLPRNAEPSRYRLTLYPDIYQADPVNFTFSGWEIITINVLLPTDRLFLHAAENLKIDFDSLTLFEYLPDDEEPLQLEFDPEPTKDSNISLVTRFYHRQFAYYELVFNKTLEVREYKLRLSWTSRLLRDLSGLYYSTYNDDLGPVYMVATQFQATAARKAFPCFDEPDYKAIFESRLVRRSSHKTLSNTERAVPKRVNINREYFLVDVYRPTVRMSSYLNAFAVHNYAFIRVTDRDDTRVLRYWFRPEWRDRAVYMSTIGAKMLDYFDDTFKTDYPFNKIDFIPFPDFSAGAMENWGLVTFAESTYYYDPKRDPHSRKEGAAAIMAHELAHMNFGNLVTAKWWDDIWLNEGFASYLEYPAMKAVDPKWATDERFLIADVLNSMRVDCLNSTRPITKPVDTPSSISAMFDTITYSKGASLCRMMEAFLPAKNFTNGLIAYQRVFKFKNTVHQDLFDTISGVALPTSNIDVHQIMDGWTNQPGYPVVNAFYVSANVLVVKFNVTQTPFELEKGNFGPRKWVVPYQPFISGLTNPLNYQYLLDEAGSFDASVSSPRSWFNNGGWFVLNVNHTGFYRINYDTTNWQRLTNQLLAVNYLNEARLKDAMTRTQLIDDALYLARAGYPVMTYTLALSLSRYLCHEYSYAPWQASLDGLNYVEQHFWQTEYDAKIKRYGRSLINNVADRIGWIPSDTETTTNHYLRTSVMSRACRWALPQCLANSSEFFSAWMDAPADYLIPTDTTSTVRCYGIKNGDDTEWWWLYELYTNSTVQTDRNNYINALGCSNDEALIQWFLDYSLKNSSVPAAEFPTIYAAVAANPYLHNLTKAFFYKNWQTLIFNSSSSTGPRRALEGAFQYVNTQEELNELQQWKAQAGNLGSAESSYNSLLVTINNNIVWMNANGPVIIDWLKNFETTPGLPSDCQLLD